MQKRLDKVPYIIFKIALFCSFLLLSASLYSQNLCYRTQTNHSEKGYLGKIHGQKLYYEVWNEYPAGDTVGHYTTLLLRTDTSDLREKMDFCLDLQHADFDTPDKMAVTLTGYGSNRTFVGSTADATDLPTIFQFLIPCLYGKQFIAGFGRRSKIPTLKFKHDTLCLHYYDVNAQKRAVPRDMKWYWKDGKFIPKKTEFQHGENEIDRLKGPKEVKNFIELHFKNDRSFPGSFSEANDSFYKLDIDGNGRTDLLISGRKLFAVLDIGNGIYNAKMVDQDDFGEMAYNVKYILTDKGELPLLVAEHLQKTDTIIFKYQGFMEYNSKSDEYEIDSIKYSTTGCYGTCPAFALSIKSCRSIMYTPYGVPFVIKDSTGKQKFVFNIDNQTFHGNIGDFYYSNLIHCINYAGFEKLDTTYAIQRTDYPSCTLTIYYNRGKKKVIHDYGLMGTISLANVYEKLFDLREKVKWE